MRPENNKELFRSSERENVIRNYSESLFGDLKKENISSGEEKKE